MIKDVNHIGICVKSIDETLALWSKNYGAEQVFEKACFPGQVSCMIRIGSLNIELMEPNGEGTVSKFIETRGEGLHHISLKSDAYEQDMKQFSENGLGIIPAAPDCGFVKPKGNAGVLMEISTGDRGQSV